ncbi:MFS transporter [Paenibacillus sp. E194]|uniref:MFS transporter n=1 Tax=Paenibacillus sp. E194 TaxID=1458845 RepID=UPI0005C80CB9|nr:MFS transporter [Paenibacillus sp. E194]KJB88161.1 MFS transporter [Paenibacillus sp. E194]
MSPILTTTSQHTDDNQQMEGNPKRWIALVIVLLPTLLISLNTYMIQVALPLMQQSLNASFAEAQIIVTGFSLGLAVALIISGKLGDIFGRKRLLLIGVSGFTIMAMLGGLTSDPSLLIAIRIVQGLAAALIQPQVLSTMQVSFPPREKAIAFSIYGAIIGFGFAFGLIFGGLIVNWNLFDLGWRMVFFVNVPFGMLVLMLLPIISESRGEKKQPIDWIGALLLISGLFLLVYPLSEGQRQGWPVWVWFCMLIGFGVLVTFVAFECYKKRRNAFPLVNLVVFRHASFRVGLLAVLVVYLGMFAFFFLLSYYVQYGLHKDVQTTSMVFLPLGVGFFLSSLLSSRFVEKWGIGSLKLGSIGMAICISLLIGSILYDARAMLNYRNLLLLWMYGFSLGMVTTPLANIVLSTVPKKDAGSGSGLFTTCMYLANSLGVALIGIVFSGVLGHVLVEAELSDYVRAFSVSVGACGGLALATFVCLCFLPDPRRKSRMTKVKHTL